MSNSEPFTEKAELWHHCSYLQGSQAQSVLLNFFCPPIYRGVDHCQVSEQHLVTSVSSHFIATVLRSNVRGTLQTPHSRILGIAAHTGDAVIEHLALVKQSPRTGIELPTTSPITIRSTAGVGGRSGAFVYSLIIALHDQNNIWNVRYAPCTFVLQRTYIFGMWTTVFACRSIKTASQIQPVWKRQWPVCGCQLTVTTKYECIEKKEKKKHLPKDFFQGFVEE